MWVASGQTRGAYREKGTGPALIFGDGALMDRFTDSYRVVLPDAFQGAAESFTADRWCADILAIADARSGPRNLDSGLSGISIVFQAAVPKPVVPKYTTSGVRRPSEL